MDTNIIVVALFMSQHHITRTIMFACATSSRPAHIDGYKYYCCCSLYVTTSHHTHHHVCMRHLFKTCPHRWIQILLLLLSLCHNITSHAPSCLHAPPLQDLPT